MYRAPGHDTFIQLLSSLVPKTDTIIIVGDSNIHVVVENDTLGTAFFFPLLNLIGFCLVYMKQLTVLIKPLILF